MAVTEQPAFQNSGFASRITQHDTETPLISIKLLVAKHSKSIQLNSSIQDELANTRLIYQCLFNERDTAEKSLQSTREELDEVRKTLEVQKMTCRTNIRDFKSLEKKSESTRQELANVKEDLQKSQSLTKASNINLQKARSDLEAAIAAHESTKKELDTRTVALSATKTDLQTAEQDLEDRRQKVSTMETELRTCQNDLNATKQTLDRTDKELKTTREELQSARCTIQGFQGFLNMLKITDANKPSDFADLTLMYQMWEAGTQHGTTYTSQKRKRDTTDDEAGKEIASTVDSNDISNGSGE